MTITFDSIRTAMVALLMRGERPVRIWLTQGDLGRLMGPLPPTHMIRMRFMGLPVTIAMVPARSRVVSASGIVEYVI